MSISLLSTETSWDHFSICTSYRLKISKKSVFQVTLCYFVILSLCNLIKLLLSLISCKLKFKLSFFLKVKQLTGKSIRVPSPTAFGR